MPCLLPEPLYPCSQPYLLLIALALAHILDLVYPYHRGILLKIHPTHTAFILVRKLAPPYSTKLRGAVAWILTVTVHLVLYAVILYAAWIVHPILWVITAAYITKTSFSLRLLVETVEAIEKAASRGDTHEVRRLTQTIVRRNVWKLDIKHVYSAALESLAESLVDGYTSPITYYYLFGPLGAVFQRIVNAMDSAIAYKTPEHHDRGWFAAKTDTAINYFPARATALVIGHRHVITCLKQYTRAIESINAGYPITAMASALNTVLEKPSHYTIPCGEALPNTNHLKRGVITAAKTALAYTTITTLAYTLAVIT